MNSSDKHLKYVGCRLDIQHKIKELKEPLQYKHMSHKKYKELKKHYKDELIHLTKDYYKNHPSYC
ncbi:hypothetical protein FACS1894218_1670 [Bacilli bacterium]|nr:hypothetical protein FACS1894218_1670 [Bacilli bacterium]